MPKSERPYEKCFENGPETLSDCELLSVILRTGVKGSSAYDLAKEIITQQGDGTNLLKIMHTTKEELLHIKGVGMVKAVQILCIGELAKRIASMPFVDNVKYDSPKKIAGYYMERLRHLEQETLHVMFLDTKCKLIKSKEITKGTIDRSMISQREIFVEALKCNAVNIVLVHKSGACDFIKPWNCRCIEYLVVRVSGFKVRRIIIRYHIILVNTFPFFFQP